ncbi:hypothetical protein DFJ74DRAFT_672182 [Hyaloraphidium curvatum]|nr:hypothetical protein DFJ74DRAFT_672182 [Hyaloraphidium curvatum]
MPWPTLDDFFSAPGSLPASTAQPPPRGAPVFRRKTVSALVGGELALELDGVCVGVYRPLSNNTEADFATIWVKDETGVVSVHVQGRRVTEAEGMMGKLVRIEAPLVKSARKNNGAKLPGLSSYTLEVNDHRGKLSVLEADPVRIDRKKYKQVLAVDSSPPISLREMVSGKSGERAFVQVLAIGEVKRTAKGVPNRTVSVSDGELVLDLCLWRSQVEIADSWKRKHTVLIVTNPRISVYGGNVQLAIGYQTLIEVIDSREAELMRSFCQMIHKGEPEPVPEPKRNQETTQALAPTSPVRSTPESNHEARVALSNHATIQDLQAIRASSTPPAIGEGFTVAILIRLDEEEKLIRWIDETGQWTFSLEHLESTVHNLALWARHNIHWRITREESGRNKIEVVRIERSTATMKELCEAAAWSL